MTPIPLSSPPVTLRNNPPLTTRRVSLASLATMVHNAARRIESPCAHALMRIKALVHLYYGTFVLR
jgi:hypothetical protein